MTTTPGGRRVLLADRDGVLVVDRPDYVTRPEQLALLPGAGAAVARAREAGYAVVVLTNQACVGMGLLTPTELDRIHAALRHLLGAEGGAAAQLDAIYVCPHHPDEGCACRKPRAGLFAQARAAWAFDPAQTFYVGDDLRDAEAARAFGCRFALVRTGKGRATEAMLAAAASRGPAVAAVEDDLAAFVERLL